MKSTIGVIIGGLAVLLAGFGLGFYYLGGTPKPVQTAQVTPGTDGTDAPLATDQSPATPATVRRPPAAAGEYTAPGAPQIAIQETAVTAAKPAATPAVKPKDSEASETGLPTDSTLPAGGNPPNLGDASDPSPQATPDVSDGSNPAPTPAADNAQPNPISTPLNSSEDGAPVGGFPQTQPMNSQRANNGASGALYHVQAGAFQSQKNAKALESALQSKGYAAMTVHQFQGGRDNYIVQVGAYSSVVTADQMVGNLQRDGFAASVSRGM